MNASVLPAAQVPTVSVVVPAHNEQENVTALYTAVSEVLDRTGHDWELIFVDDGSADDTIGRVRALRSTDGRVRLIRLVRNFGHQAAVMAGIAHARGQAIITMDCDLQHPPRFIPQMLDKWRQGYEVVQMCRTATVHISPWKRWLSNGFYWLINRISEAKITPGAADFQLLDRTVANELLSLRDPEPFVRGMIGWLGFRFTTIHYVADERHAGAPSYTLRRSIRLARAGLTMMSRKPLRLGLYLGGIGALVSVIYLVFVLYAYVQGNAIPGWASLAASVLFIGAVQLIVLGIMGEYLLQIYERSRNLPAYVAYPEESASREVPAAPPLRLPVETTAPPL